MSKDTYIKINPTVKKKWLKALRSGEYAQTKGKLCSLGPKHDSFCCLGVLQDLAVREGVSDWQWDNGVSKYEDSGLGEDTMDWSGLDEGLDWMSSESQEVLVGLNDEEGYSFKEIANWIEANL